MFTIDRSKCLIRQFSAARASGIISDSELCSRVELLSNLPIYMIGLVYKLDKDDDEEIDFKFASLSHPQCIDLLADALINSHSEGVKSWTVVYNKLLSIKNNFPTATSPTVFFQGEANPIDGSSQHYIAMRVTKDQLLTEIRRLARAITQQMEEGERKYQIVFRT